MYDTKQECRLKKSNVGNFLFKKMAMKPVRARLQLVRAHLCPDLYENFFGGQLMSY